MSASDDIQVVPTSPGHFEQIIEICSMVYPDSRPWNIEQLTSHLEQFPEGQISAVDSSGGRVLGMSASLIVVWDDYDYTSSWMEFTARGYFTNHDAENGRTLYGAEVMVAPEQQGKGIGKLLYAARRQLVERLGLRRIRAGARLTGYGAWADRLSPEAYVAGVIKGEIGDPTLSFQLKQGFRVLTVTDRYLPHDTASRGYAAVIEWLNPAVVRPDQVAGIDPRLARQLQ